MSTSASPESGERSAFFSKTVNCYTAIPLPKAILAEVPENQKEKQFRGIRRTIDATINKTLKFMKQNSIDCTILHCDYEIGVRPDVYNQINELLNEKCLEHEGKLFALAMLAYKMIADKTTDMGYLSTLQVMKGFSLNCTEVMQELSEEDLAEMMETAAEVKLPIVLNPSHFTAEIEEPKKEEFKEDGGESGAESEDDDSKSVKSRAESAKSTKSTKSARSAKETAEKDEAPKGASLTLETSEVLTAQAMFKLIKLGCLDTIADPTVKLVLHDSPFLLPTLHKLSSACTDSQQEHPLEHYLQHNVCLTSSSGSLSYLRYLSETVEKVVMRVEDDEGLGNARKSLERCEVSQAERQRLYGTNAAVCYKLDPHLILHTLSPFCVINTNAVRALSEKLKGESSDVDFIMFGNRLASVLVEEVLGLVRGSMCVVSIMRDGDVVSDVVRNLAPGIPSGKMLPNGSSILPDNVLESDVLIVDAVIRSGERMVNAVASLLELGVAVERIVIVCMYGCEAGVAKVQWAYSSNRIVMLGLDEVLGGVDFGERYYGKLFKQ